MLTSIISAVVILALLIIVHEAGHFVVAKRLGVRVIRFSIGYPPKVWGIRRGETEYAIGATPFGGYVRMLGEEVGEEPRSEELENYARELALDVVGAARAHGWTPPTGADSDTAIMALVRELDSAGQAAPAMGESGRAPAAVSASRLLGRDFRPEEAAVLDAIGRFGSVAEAVKAVAERQPIAVMRSFQKRAFPTQRLAKRVAIVLAGPLSNILFAPILMTIVFMYGVPMLAPTVGKVQAGMPAAVAGLQAGDQIISVNGAAIKNWNEFSEMVKSSGGHALAIKFKRRADSEPTTVVVAPKREEEPTIYGNKAPAWVIGVLPHGEVMVRRYGPVGALEHGVIGSIEMTKTLAVGVYQIINGSTPVRQALGGPIMIAQLAGREAREGFASLLIFTVMLSLELGIINLFPIPLLDGGHLLFFLCEGIRGEPLNLRHREMALQVGLFLLVALMAFVIFNDISRIVQG